MAAFDDMLGPLFAGRSPDIAEENIQSRIRGLTLMAISNKFGPMLLTTGNKSEMSTGYATIYGDMAGGFSVLKDVYKTTVFRLSEWRNAHHPRLGLGPRGPVMPQRVIDKPPTAELRDNQRDDDSLPPYDLLDRILAGLIEDEASASDLVRARASTPRPSRGSSACSTSPNTSAARPRRGSRSAGGTSGGTGAIRLRTRSGQDVAWTARSQFWPIFWPEG